MQYAIKKKKLDKFKDANHDGIADNRQIKSKLYKKNKLPQYTVVK